MRICNSIYFPQIQVEFVPEKAEITIGNKSNIATPSDKKAGTVRVQFIPGEVFLFDIADQFYIPQVLKLIQQSFTSSA